MPRSGCRLVSCCHVTGCRSTSSLGPVAPRYIQRHPGSTRYTRIDPGTAQDIEQHRSGHYWASLLGAWVCVGVCVWGGSKAPQTWRGKRCRIEKACFLNQGGRPYNDPRAIARPRATLAPSIYTTPTHDSLAKNFWEKLWRQGRIGCTVWDTWYTA